MGSPYHLCLQTLSNELRMKIIDILRQGPIYVEEMADLLEIERSVVSHSLKMLKQCNIVDVKKEGRKNLYYLKDKTILSHPGDSLFQIIDKHVAEYCGSCSKRRK